MNNQKKEGLLPSRATFGRGQSASHEVAKPRETGSCRSKLLKYPMTYYLALYSVDHVAFGFQGSWRAGPSGGT